MAESPLPDLPPPPPPPPPRPPKASSTPVQDLPPSSSTTSNGHPSKNSHSNDTGTGETPVAGVVPVLSTSTSTSGERDPSLLVKAVSPSSTRSPPSTATTTTSNSNNHHTKTKTTTTGSDAIPSSASESHSSSPTPSPPSAPAPAPAVDHHHDNDNEESKVPATASHAIQGGDTSTAQQGEMTPASSSEENRSQAASPRPNSSSRPPPTSIHPPPPTSSSHHPPRPPSHSSHSQPHVPPYDEQQPAALNSNSHLASLLAQAYKDAEALRTEAASSKARAERAERRLSLYESDSFSIQPQPSSQPTTTESQREQLALLTSLETQLAASEAAHADAQGRLQHVVDAWGEYERWLRVVDVRVGDARGAVGTVVGEARAALEGAGVRRAVDAMEVDSVAQPLPPFSRPRLSIHPQQQAYAASTRESMRPPISSGTTVPISMPMTIAGQSLPASNSGQGQGQGTLYVPATSPFHPGRVRPRTASLEGMGQGGVAKRPRSMASDPVSCFASGLDFLWRSGGGGLWFFFPPVYSRIYRHPPRIHRPQRRLY
ncbi:hypothetical protein BDV98DRAFT_110372 [Pterulicium gracile]|uniref:Uncharacterized protein n=1 Tax=Pterulicium gracile TaxID=1884261 RepID=A0A5C3QFG9_9AGAR|nr:hypothetical protein BDV98DRAFT_110372 [Pterula gracilis]